MSSKVTITEFHPEQSEPIRLCMLLGDKTGWRELAMLGPQDAATMFSTLEISDYSTSATRMFFEELTEHGWIPVQGFWFVTESGNHVGQFTVFDLYQAIDPETERQIIRWFFHDLCGLEFDRHMGYRESTGHLSFHDLLVPLPVDDALFEAWRTSKEYEDLHARVRSVPMEVWSSDEFSEDITRRLQDLLLAASPMKMMEWDSLSGPSVVKRIGSIAENVYFDGVEHYTISLDISSPPLLPLTTGRTPLKTSWSIFFEGSDVPRNTTGEVYHDLYTALIGHHCLIPESRFDAWLDANLLSPVQIFHEVDVEPYLLLDATVPWLLPSSEALAFFTSLGMAVPLENQ